MAPGLLDRPRKAAAGCPAQAEAAASTGVMASGSTASLTEIADNAAPLNPIKPKMASRNFVDVFIIDPRDIFPSGYYPHLDQPKQPYL